MPITIVKLNNLKSAGKRFSRLIPYSFPASPLPVSSERIQAFIAEMDLQAQTSINRLAELKKESRDE